MAPQTIDTSDGISWHVEMFPPRYSNHSSADHEQEYVILVPSGEGDCDNLLALARLLSECPYHVVTFDMPGFSRTIAPPEAYEHVTPSLLAKQIIGLMDGLGIQRASAFGCSSGGGATLALCAFYPDRIKCGIVHEVPLDAPEMLYNLQKLDDAAITAACQGLFGNVFVEQEENDGRKKWENMGEEYHARLTKNYVTWVRSYVNSVEVGGRAVAIEPENSRRRPIFWTVGELNNGVEHEQGFWQSNFALAKNAGVIINTTRLRCLHFPAVTIPQELAGWIEECIMGVKA